MVLNQTLVSALVAQVFKNLMFIADDQKFLNRQSVRKLPLTHAQKWNLTPQLAAVEMKSFLCNSGLNLLNIGSNCSV